MKMSLPIVVTLFALSILPGITSAQSNSLPWERFTLSAGGFFASTDSSIFIGSQRFKRGVDIDLEDVLGMEDSTTVFRADSLWRFTDNLRHQLNLSWFAINRDATRRLSRAIQIGDTVYPLGTAVDSSFDFQIFKGTYGYSLYQSEKLDFAASIGLYTVPIEFRIRDTAGLLKVESTDLIAPLPVLGLKLYYALTPNLFLKQKADLFYLEYEQYRGGILNYEIDLEYNFTDHLGVGVGFDTFKIWVEADGEDYPGIDLIGNLDFNYAGLLLYAKVHF